MKHKVAAEHRLGNQAIVWRWSEVGYFGGEKHRAGEKRKKDRAAHPPGGVEQTRKSYEPHHAAV